ncbi:rhodanese-like domain-containing protein [Roseateles sp. YR242]|uniref:rhodanese-like domain-containing protein n=1 Tax=Roseateles sp. YR242 TaxID=1855305 RepID=UPI0015A57B3A|nr:rhodanese-like domain-containing protein [Roseateles sp. YR242]
MRTLRTGWTVLLTLMLIPAAQADSEIGGTMPDALKGIHPSGYSCQRDDIQRNAKSTAAPAQERPGPDLSCAVEPSQWPGLAGKRPVLMVDTRSPQAFEATHVDGALNATPVQLRAKPYLRDRTLVLMGSGRGEQEQYVACAELKAQGFPDVRVLRGGLARWVGQGRAVVGRSAVETDVPRLSATELWLEQQFGANLVLVAPSHAALLPQLPYAMALKSLSASAVQAVLERRRKELKNAPLAAVILVSDGSGEALQALGAALPAVPLLSYSEPVDSYLREMRQQQLTWNAQTRGPKQPPCRR